jgi:hypothetical protein
MELYECEDAVQKALQQRRPQHIVGIINKAGEQRVLPYLMRLHHCPSLLF